MILPERVLGSVSVKRISSGRAIAPISLTTWLRSPRTCGENRSEFEKNHLAAAWRSGYISHVKKANIAELKNRLSHYLSRVKRGETVLVMERATPIARLVPTAPPSRMNSDETEAWLRRLEANGVLRLGMRKGVPEVTKSPPSGKRPAGVVKTLLEERERR